ncbi:hypothetical protein COOONC_17325 [Cooperia oncophora]
MHSPSMSSSENGNPRSRHRSSSADPSQSSGETEAKGDDTTIFAHPQSLGKEDSHSKVESASAPAAKHAHSLRRRPTHSVEDRQTAEDEEEAAKIEKKRREARIAQKDIRCKELVAATEAADGMTSAELRRWTAADDVALVTAVTHVHDLRAAYGSIKFSRPYSLEDIEER